MSQTHTTVRLNSPIGLLPLGLTGVVILLAAVGVLQYRWTNEAINAEKLRVEAELYSSSIEWRAGLYGEFFALCSALKVGPEAGGRDTWNDYLVRYTYVHSNADLVK